DLSRLLQGAARSRDQAPAAPAAGPGQWPAPRGNAGQRRVLRFRRGVRSQVRRHLDADRRSQVRLDCQRRRRCRGRRQPRLPAQYRGPLAPARRRDDPRAAHRRSAGRRGRALMSAAGPSQAMYFKERAGAQVRNPVLQRALQKAKPLFVGKRAKGIAALADDDLEFEGLRTACEGIRNRVLADLDVWLAIFEDNARASGAEVLWARNGEEICERVIEVARRHGVTKATKSKSMLSEEAGLN